MLIDAVSSSRFITQKKSQVLAKKLMGLSNEHRQKELKRNIYAANRVKSRSKSLLYTVDTANEAITKKKKITFNYTEYSPEKKKVYRHDGEVYILSPYALFWNEDYYYIVGYSDKYDNISAFRADRVASIAISDEKAVKKPADFSVEKYSTEVFEMFDTGEIIRVKLQCRNEHMKYIIDRFGEDIETEIATDATFYAYPEVALSPNFYSWVFKFAGEIRILSPVKTVNELTEMAQKLIAAETI
ncbi:MAG: WYL domain-containing protein [Bacillota bacterium]|nr:WYL domain-containing protein [Bacillota bacterium]